MPYYSASKFVLKCISDVLSREVRDLGIKFTAMVPRTIRTGWTGHSMIRSRHLIADYAAVFDPVRKHRQEYSGH